MSLLAHSQQDGVLEFSNNMFRVFASLVEAIGLGWITS